jgi:hypothetical protein
MVTLHKVNYNQRSAVNLIMIKGRRKFRIERSKRNRVKKSRE